MKSPNFVPVMFAAVLMTGAAVTQPVAASALSFAPAVDQSSSTQSSGDTSVGDSTQGKTKGHKHSKKHSGDTLNNATGRGGAGGTTGLAGAGVSDSSNANSGGSGTQTGGAGNVGPAPGAGTKSNSVPTR